MTHLINCKLNINFFNDTRSDSHCTINITNSITNVCCMPNYCIHNSAILTASSMLADVSHDV